MRTFIIPATILALALALGCSKKEDIRAESSGASGTGGHHIGAGGGSATSSTAGAGGSGPGAGGSGAGSCCAEPVHVAGHVKTITADSDPAQFATVVAAPVGNEQFFKAIDGPFVLTDATGSSSATFLLYSRVGSDCTTESATDPVLAFVETTGSTLSQVHGVRGFVPSGSVLCVSAGPGRLTISGFRPY